MDTYKRFDKYFQYSYFNKDNKKVGVFKKGTPKLVLAEARRKFDVIEFE